jgi:hypothetical protein
MRKMWNMVSLTYKAGDNINFSATVQNQVLDFDASVSNSIGFIPAVQIAATKNIKVTASYDCEWTGVGSAAEAMTTQIPVVFSFAL